MIDFPWAAGGILSTPIWGYPGPGLILQVLIFLGEIHLEEAEVAEVTVADSEGLVDFSEAVISG